MGGPARNGRPGSHGSPANAGNRTLGRARTRIGKVGGAQPHLRFDVKDTIEYIVELCDSRQGVPKGHIRVTELANAFGKTQQVFKHLQRSIGPGIVSQKTALREVDRQVEGIRTSEIFLDDEGEWTWEGRETDVEEDPYMYGFEEEDR